MALDIFKNEGTLEKDTLDWGFKENPFTLYNYVLVANI